MTVIVDPRWLSELADELRPALVKSMRTMAAQLRQLRRELQGGSR